MNVKSNKIKCVLLDVDGVVINSEMFSVQYQKKFGVSDNEMLPFFTGVFQDCIIGKADLKVSLKEWLPRWRWQGTVDEFLQFWFEAEHNIDKQVIEVIEKLKKKGIKCYIATNQEKYRVQYMKEEMGFCSIFDKIFSSGKIGAKKPEKEFYEFILNDLKKQDNIKSKEIIFLDDDQGNIDGAKATGINSYLYTDIEEFKKVIENNKLI